MAAIMLTNSMSLPNIFVQSRAATVLRSTALRPALMSLKSGTKPICRSSAVQQVVSAAAQKQRTVATVDAAPSALSPVSFTVRDRRSYLVGLAGTLMAFGGPLLLAARALADEGEVSSAADAASQQVTEAVQSAPGQAVQTAGSSGPTPLGFLIIFAPLIIYGLFSVYRAKVNPRAKLSDLAFAVVALIIVGNLISILLFKQRLY